MAGFLGSGVLADVALAGAEVVPLLLVGWLARLGAAHGWARVFSGLTAWALILLLAVFGVGVTAVAYEGVPTVDRIFGGVALATLAALLGTLLIGVGPLRRLALLRLGLDSSDHVHRIALLLTAGLTFVNLAPLVGSGGRAVFTDWLARDSNLAAAQSPLAMLLPLVWVIPAVLVAAGYGIHRDWSEVVDRLGLRWPGWRQIGFGALLGLGLVPLAMVVGSVLTQASVGVGLPQTPTDALDRLLGLSSMTLVGALALSISAGVGEELAVRGLLQPKLGLLLPNLLFAALHAWQYTLDGVVLVFLLGLVFGVLRRRTNTIVAMVCHGIYDLALVTMIMTGGPS